MRSLLVLGAASFGSIAGAVVTYSIFGVIYRILFPGPVTSGEECARGEGLALLSILLGAVAGAFLAGRYVAEATRPVELD
jgi:hypothetical protein